MTIQDPRRLTGIQKVAIIILSLSPENVRLVFDEMNSEEITKVTYAMSNLGNVSPEVVICVLEEFRDSLGAKTSIFGNVQSTQNILRKSLDQSKADQIINDIIGPQGRNTWEKLTNVNEERLTRYLQNEHPQTAALIISKLPAKYSANILKNIDKNIVQDIILRVLNLNSVDGKVLEKIEDILRSEFISDTNKTYSQNSLEIIADIFHNLDKNTEEKYMDIIEKYEKDKAQKIKDLMFTFEDIIHLTNQSVQKLVKFVDKNQLVIALKGASDDVRNFFFSNISQRAVKIFVEQMEDMGMVKVKNVLQAQAEIIKIVKDLSAKGEIEINQGNQDEYIK